MDEQVLAFIAALRAAGVRISLAESADALRSIQALGIAGRQVFRAGLLATLIKEQRDIVTFDVLFPLFFGSANAPAMPGLRQSLSSDQSQALQALLEQYKERIQQLLERLLDGRPLSQDELERLARLVGLNNIDNLRFRDWMAQRMQRALGLEELRQVLRELQARLIEGGLDESSAGQLAAALQAGQQSLSDQLHRFAGQRIAQNMAEVGQRQETGGLLERPFGSLSDHELDTLRKQVRRLANALRTSAALRQKRSKSGHLDPKATIRANLKHGSVPIEIHRHDKTLQPRLVAICDISTSMRACSEFMLGLLYALQDQISKTQAFAFIDHLEHISPDFEGNDANTAIQRVLRRLPSGYYNTDLGWSLSMFHDAFLDMVDRRTTLIIVGDGRNNYNDPHLEILHNLKRRVRQVIWLNPEPRIAWGSGDSDMLKYEPLCDQIYQVSNMAQLMRAVDQILA
jgi:hypothetical protein